MRTIPSQRIEDAVRDLFLSANYRIGEDIRSAVRSARDRETTATGKSALEQILANYDVASDEEIAICQDTGMAMLFARLGQDVHIDGDFVDAVNRGVRQAYTRGCLRASIVNEPLFDRKNTGDNTPAVIHVELVPGDGLELTAVAKGFGSENASRSRMFAPQNTIEEIRDFVVETVALAGPNSCPPVIVGVGIGGTLDMAALLAKKATIRKVGDHHPDSRYAELEKAWLGKINTLGCGPGGLGGRATAVWLAVNTFPTHIGSIPVVVNMCCHASRHAGISL